MTQRYTWDDAASWWVDADKAEDGVSQSTDGGTAWCPACAARTTFTIILPGTGQGWVYWRCDGCGTVPEVCPWAACGCGGIIDCKT